MVKLCSDPSKLDAKYFMHGCCCSQVIPNAPPHPDTPLNTCPVPLSRAALYSPWSFFLSPKTQIVEPKSYGNIRSNDRGRDCWLTVEFQGDRRAISIRERRPPAAEVARLVGTPSSRIGQYWIILLYRVIGHSSSTREHEHENNVLWKDSLPCWCNLNCGLQWVKHECVSSAVLSLLSQVFDGELVIAVRKVVCTKQDRWCCPILCSVCTQRLRIRVNLHGKWSIVWTFLSIYVNGRT